MRWFVLLAAIVLSGCNIHQKIYQLDKSSPKAELMVIADKRGGATKRILHIDAYDINECTLDTPLTREHPSYQGVLLYHTQDSEHQIEETTIIKANQPITLSLSLSHLSESYSHICYSRFIQFVPKNNAQYELELDEFCEVKIFIQEPGVEQKLIDDTVVDMIQCT